MPAPLPDFAIGPLRGQEPPLPEALAQPIEARFRLAVAEEIMPGG